MEIKICLSDNIQNLDILDLVNRGIRYCEDIANSSSAKRNETSVHDIKRMKSALAVFISRFDFYNSEPELDAPSWCMSGRAYPDFTTIELVQNADIQAVLNAWVMLILEISKSDSAGRSTGFKSADSARIAAMIAKIGKLLDTIEKSPEIDLLNVE